MRQLCLSALVALWAGLAAAGPVEDVLDKLRIFNNPRAIESFSQLCESGMNKFSRCIAGQPGSKPRHTIGNGFVTKVERMMSAMRRHPNVVEINSRAERIQNDCFRHCLAPPQVAIDCIMDAAINGDPWNDVTQCMKDEFGTGNVNLNVPELGNLDKTKEDLKMFMNVALYRFWNEKGEGAFWDKIKGTMDIICPASPVSPVQRPFGCGGGGQPSCLTPNKAQARACMASVMSDAPENLNVEVKHLVRRSGPSSLTFAAPRTVGELTFFGDQVARDFIKKRLFFQQTSGCVFHFVKGRGMGALTSKHECAYAAFPKCLHYMWTLKDGICTCRTRTTSNPAMDPFKTGPGGIRGWILQAQEDYINGVTKPNWKCHLKGDNAQNCPTCVALAKQMVQEFTRDPKLRDDFIQSFKPEIQIVVDMLKELCAMGTQGGKAIVYDNSRYCKAEGRKLKLKARARNSGRGGGW